MTFVVRRPRGYEIRESHTTPEGPRARSLATFTVLDDVVLAKARARALRPFRADAVVASARRIGAPVAVEQPPDRRARALLAEMGAGRRPSPVLAALLRQALGPTIAVDDNVDAAAAWVGVTDERRGRALDELLDLADAVPLRRRPERVAFPRIVSGG